MKIAVCGSGTSSEEEILKKSFQIGKEIAKNNIMLVTGGGTGYPLEAAKGAFLNKGKVIGMSPAKNEKEHKEAYGFTTEYFSEIIYTGKGIPQRNFDIIENSDAVIVIGGQIGTLNEFTIAFQLRKIIGVLKNSGGVSDIIEKIADICKKGYRDADIIYSDRAELVSKVIERFNNK